MTETVAYSGDPRECGHRASRGSCSRPRQVLLDGMVGAEYSAAALQGVLAQGAGWFGFAELGQGVGQRAGRQQGDRVEMPTLSDAKLTITVDTGTHATVTASVDVIFSDDEKVVMTVFPFVNYLATCKIFGADGGIFGGDDGLFQLGNAVIRSDQDDLTFTRVVQRSALDEDAGDDEIYAEFTCVPNDSPFNFKSATPVNSSKVIGSF